MINIVVGKPGTGKTYFLVKKAWEFHRQGLDVYSNFKLDFSWLHKKNKLYGNIYYWEDLEDLLSIRGGQILIDECQIYFNSRGWKDLPPKLQYKFQQHRKHRGQKGQSLDIWGAVQNVKRIDTVVRELVNSVYQLKKFGPFMQASEYDIDQIDKEKKQCYSRTRFFLSKKIYMSYDTYAEIDGFKDPVA